MALLSARYWNGAMDHLFDLVVRLVRVVSLRDLFLVAVVIAIACAIPLLVIQPTRKRVKNLLLAQDRQARAVTVLASRLDNLAQQLAQLQHERPRQREQVPASTAEMTADMGSLRDEIESLRKEFL